MPCSETTEGQGGNNLYVVEKILDKRIISRKVQYLIKWEGYGYKDTTWEPKSHLLSKPCSLAVKKMVSDFEKEWATKMKSKSYGGRSVFADTRKGYKVVHAAGSDDTGSEGEDQDSTNGDGKPVEEDASAFDRGLEVEEIRGATDSGGELQFLIKWEGTQKLDLVPFRLARVKCPQIVIKYFQDRLVWTNENRINNL